MSSTSAILLFLGLAIVSARRLEIPQIQRLQQQTKVLSEQNPRNGQVCFAEYRPQLDNISQSYESQYNYCNNQFANQTALEDDRWQLPRQDLLNSGEHACTMMQDCSTIVGYVEAFECYAQVGADESKSLYTISANATEIAVEIKEFYRAIETTRTICINNAERTYVEDTTTTYESLNGCLSGQLSLSTEVISTTVITTTTV